MRRSNAEFRHHLFQVTADSVFQPHLEIFQNLTLNEGLGVQNYVKLTVNVVVFATKAISTVVAVMVLVVAQIEHNLHSADFWPPPRASIANMPRVKNPTQPSQSLSPHWTSTSLVVPGRTALRRWRVVAVPSVLTHCQMRRSVRTALWPHSALWASHREVGRWPRCGALAQIGPRLRSNAEPESIAMVGEQLPKQLGQPPVCPFEQL